MNTNMKELNLNEMEQANGGWLVTCCVILVWGATLCAIPYIFEDKQKELSGKK